MISLLLSPIYLIPYITQESRTASERAIVARRATDPRVVTLWDVYCELATQEEWTDREKNSNNSYRASENETGDKTTRGTANTTR